MAGLNFLFRADAEPAMGTGHVMRCLALAQALRDLRHNCHMACAALPSTLAERLSGEGITLHRLENPVRGPYAGATMRDVEATLHIASGIDAAAVVVDGYHFDADWRRTLYGGAKTAGRTVLAMLDDADGPVDHADLVLNPASQAPPSPICLLGSRFVLLRRDIRQAIAEVPTLSSRTYILVSFGGSDPQCLTLPVATALAGLLQQDEARLSVVLGGAVEGADDVAAALGRLGPRVEAHRDVREMGPLMAGAGLAISAGGTTLGELAALAVPTLVVPVADNQIEGSRHAAASGWCRVLDGDGMNPAIMAAEAHNLWRDLPMRAVMAAKAAGLADGQGAIRVAETLIRFATHSLTI